MCLIKHFYFAVCRFVRWLVSLISLKFEHKMTIVGNEWTQPTEQDAADAIQNYSNNYSEDPAKLDFIIFGTEPIQQLLSVEGAKGVKIKSSMIINEDTEELQYFPIIVPVDGFGNELPFEYVPESANRGGGDGNPVKCPTSCS